MNTPRERECEYYAALGKIIWGCLGEGYLELAWCCLGKVIWGCLGEDYLELAWCQWKPPCQRENLTFPGWTTGFEA